MIKGKVAVPVGALPLFLPYRKMLIPRNKMNKKCNKMYLKL